MLSTGLRDFDPFRAAPFFTEPSDFRSHDWATCITTSREHCLIHWPCHKQIWRRAPA